MRLSLNKTWGYCLSMWRWIKSEVELYGVAKFNKLSNGDKEDFIKDLKKQWLTDNGFEDGRVSNDCFLCYYDIRKRGEKDHSCDNCPTKLAGSPMHCNIGTKFEYLKTSFCINPIGFCNRLENLNRKRLKK